MEINLFDFTDWLKKDPCLLDDELYLPEDTWFKWDKLQGRPLDVAALKKEFGDRFSLEINFIGNILIKAGVRADGKSFLWCGEALLQSSRSVKGFCEIDLSAISYGTLEITLYARAESAVYGQYDAARAVEEIDPAKVLYEFISPTYELCCEEPLYYHFSGGKNYYSFENRHIYLKPGSSVDLITYFNSFSAVKWKKYTNVENLEIYLDFSGDARVVLVHVHEKKETGLKIWLVQSENRGILRLNIGEYPGSGIIGVRLYAEKECFLYGGGYLTEDLPMREVRLGIGITTYQRENEVKKSIARLGGAIARHPWYKEKIKITVVDNGRTLVPEDVPDATLIANKNLGGTGGFMRSLIHYKDEGECTHCLFMDDDASCEPSSIFRSHAFVRHAKEDSLAISGAMLSENIQFMQWENGAWFDQGCHPLHCDYDLRDPKVLAANEKEEKYKTYGAWWFFLFPVNHVKSYSFPFFVRGDDIQFSYINEFVIARINGVGIWQEDFKTKESPLTLYMDIRSHILHHMALENINRGPWQILKMVWKFFNRFNLSYQYDTANAIASSFLDMQAGPKYWTDNLDMANIREKIKNNYKIERLKDIEQKSKKVARLDGNKKYNSFNRIIKKISFNGHLIPAFMLNNKIGRLEKYEIPCKDKVYRIKKILICSDLLQKQYMLKRNSRYFFSNIYKIIEASSLFLLRYKNIREEYKKYYKTLETDRFWKDVFGDK